MPEDKLRVVAPDVGGGFGAKLQVYAEEAARQSRSRQALGRPVKWTETRSEHMTDVAPRPRPDRPRDAGGEERRQDHRRQAATVADLGAYFQLLTPFIPELGFPVASGCYDIPAIELDFTGVFTNKFADRRDPRRRAAGGDVLDRADDGPARGTSWAWIRSRCGARTSSPKEAVPVRDARSGSSTTRATTRARSTSCSRTSTSTRSGASRRSCASKGVYRGIGFSTYVEVCGLAPSRAVGPQGVGLQAAFWESAVVRVQRQRLGDRLHGHLAARPGARHELRPDRGRQAGHRPAERRGDPRRHRHRPVGLGHVRLALAVGRRRGDRPRGRQGAGQGQADLRRAARGGARGHRAGRRQVPGEGLAGQVDDDGRDRRARRTSRPNELPTDIEPGLEETSFYDPENFVFPFGAHACVVDVDAETGKVEVVRYSAVDDCGPAINPMLIDGQVHGGITHAHRAGAVRAGRLRRGRPARDGHVRRLRAAHRGGGAELRDRPHGDAVAGQLARRQGRRRGRARSPPRRRWPTRCIDALRAARRGVDGHAVHADARVAGDRGGPGRRWRPAGDRAGPRRRRARTRGRRAAAQRARTKEVRSDPAPSSTTRAGQRRRGDPALGRGRRGREAARRRPLAAAADEAAAGGAVAAGRHRRHRRAARLRPRQRRLARSAR